MAAATLCFNPGALSPLRDALGFMRPTDPGCARGAWLPLMYEAAQTRARYRCSNKPCAPVFGRHRVWRHALSCNLIIVKGETGHEIPPPSFDSRRFSRRLRARSGGTTMIVAATTVTTAIATVISAPTMTGVTVVDEMPRARTEATR